MANAGVKLTMNSQEYQQKMKEMVASMKSLGSEFSLTATQAKLTGDRFGVLKSTVEGLTQKVELQKNIVKANTEQFERLSKNLDEQKTKHDEIAKKVEAAKKAYNESAAATGKNSEESQKLKKTLDQLNDDLSESTRRVSASEVALNNQKVKTDKSNVALLEMSTRLREVAQKLKDAKLDEFAAKCDKVATSAENVAKKTALISGAAAGIEIAAAKSAMSFEDAMAKVNTIADSSVVSYDNMKQAIIDLSNETGIAAEDIADNVYNAISAGQETGDAVNFVREATKLATAGFTESSNSLDILTTIMNAYGLEAGEVKNVSDQLITTQNLGKTTVGELSQNMGKVIPTAKAFNVSLDQVNTGYVKLTANGIKTAESTTYMNAMLNELGKSGTITDKILREKTGKSFSDLMASGSSLGDVLAIIEKEATAQNKQFTDMFSSSEAAKAGLVLIKDGADGFNATLGQMNDSSGATDNAFEKMQTTSFKLKLTFNEVKNTLIDFGTSVLTTLEPTITKISEKIKELTTWFNNLDAGTKENIVKAGLFVAAIAPVALGISKVAKGVKGAINVYKSFRDMGAKVITMLTSEKAALIAHKVATTAASAATKVWSAIQAAFNAVMAMNPIALIIIGITALIAAVVLMYNKCEWFRNMINTFFEWIKPAVSAVGGFISGVFNTIASVATKVWNAISGVISTVMNVIWSVISTVWNAISNVVSVVLGVVWTIISTYWNIYSTIISTVMNVIWSVISTVWNAISNAISVVLGVIMERDQWSYFDSDERHMVSNIDSMERNKQCDFCCARCYMGYCINNMERNKYIYFNSSERHMVSNIDGMERNKRNYLKRNEYGMVSYLDRMEHNQFDRFRRCERDKFNNIECVQWNKKHDSRRVQ